MNIVFVRFCKKLKTIITILKKDFVFLVTVCVKRTLE